MMIPKWVRDMCGSKKYIRSFLILWWLCVVGAIVLVIGFVYFSYLIIFKKLDILSAVNLDREEEF